MSFSESRTWRDHAMEELLLHGESFFRLVQARVEVRLRGWKVSLEGMTDCDGAGVGDEADVPALGEVRRLEAALLRSSRWIPGTTCIHRSLAAVRILRRRGSPARVVIGLRRRGSRFQGHAWVEIAATGQICRAFWSPEGGYVEIEDLRLAQFSFL